MSLLLLVILGVSAALLIGFVMYAIRESHKSRTESREAKTEARLARSEARQARAETDLHMKAIEAFVGVTDGADQHNDRHLRSLNPCGRATPSGTLARHTVKRRRAVVFTTAAAGAFVALTFPPPAPHDDPLMLQLPIDPPIATSTDPAPASDPPSPSDPQVSTAPQPSAAPTSTATDVSVVAGPVLRPSSSAPPRSQPGPPVAPTTTTTTTTARATSAPLKVCPLTAVQVSGPVHTPCVAP